MVGQPDVDAGQQRGGAVFSGSQSSVGVAAADLGFDGLEIADEGHAFLGNRRGSGSGDLDKLAARVMVWIPPFARPQRWRKLGGMRNKQEVFMSHRIATAMVASTRDPNDYKSDRHFPAWLGLVPRQNSTGGVDRLGGISKRGNGYLRRLLIHGSRSIMRWRSKAWIWLAKLRGRRPANVATVAVANKTARIIWAIMKYGGVYGEPANVRT